jgi:DNA repair protein RecO (recombination protein O)
MHIRAPAILCAVRPHGEHGAVVRALTAEHGLLAGYVQGARSRTLRPVLQPSNTVIAEWRARTAEQLPSLSVDLLESRAPLFAEPQAAAGLDWVCALTAASLPEAHPYPVIHDGLEAVISAIAAAPSARGWAAVLVRYEALLLASLGYGGDVPDAVGEWDAMLAALDVNGLALEEHLFRDRRVDVMAARHRLIERLKRAVA